MEQLTPATGQVESLPAHERVPLRFNGEGSEYFGIWIVNLLLSILTLGIYSAWAKVRRLKYFYRNTRLADGGFDFHASPVNILKGRIIGLALFLVYNYIWNFSIIAGFVVLALLMVIVPPLLRSALRFRMVNSSYRGLRFGFNGDMRGAYEVFLFYPLLCLVTLYLLVPYAHRQIKRYQGNHSWYGSADFNFDAAVGSFYKIYLVCFGLLLLGPIAMAGLGGFGGLLADAQDPERVQEFVTRFLVLGVLVFVLMYLLIQPYYTSRFQNLIWNNLKLDDRLHFESALPVRALFWVQLTNMIGLILTLGLFKPWADVRVARLRIESINAVTESGDLESFVNDPRLSESAVGAETADFFDFDIGL